MSFAPPRGEDRLELVVAPGHGSPGTSKAAPRKPTREKLSVMAAWSAWQADDATESSAAFLVSVSSWTEGTAAQLLRRRWPAGVKRPTAPEVQERLRHHLARAARQGPSTYLEALESARAAVSKELRQAKA